MCIENVPHINKRATPSLLPNAPLQIVLFTCRKFIELNSQRQKYCKIRSLGKIMPKNIEVSFELELIQSTYLYISQLARDIIIYWNSQTKL